MTREEQKRLRELKKPFEQAFRSAGKTRGWKTISGIQYQVRGGMLYELFPDLPPVDRGTMASAWLCCKPVALDGLYWQVFHLEEQAAKMPFSFHVNGAFTAPELTLERWKTPLPGPEALDGTAAAVFDRAETLVEENPFPTAPSFRQAVERSAESSHRTLSVILCLLWEEAYEEAAQAIDDALARGEDGGYLHLNGGSILEDAREWCAARMAEGAVT